MTLAEIGVNSVEAVYDRRAARRNGNHKDAATGGASWERDHVSTGVWDQGRGRIGDRSCTKKFHIFLVAIKPRYPKVGASFHHLTT